MYIDIYSNILRLSIALYASGKCLIIQALLGCDGRYGLRWTEMKGLELGRP